MRASLGSDWLRQKNRRRGEATPDAQADHRRRAIDRVANCALDPDRHRACKPAGVLRRSRAIAIIAALFVLIALAGCSGRTAPPMNVTSTSATFHAAVTWSSTSEHGVTWFEYSGDGGQTWAQTPHVPGGDQSVTCRIGVADDRGGNFTQTVTGLRPVTDYVYRLAATWCGATKPSDADSSGTVNGTELQRLRHMGPRSDRPRRRLGGRHRAQRSARKGRIASSTTTATGSGTSCVSEP